MFEGEEKKRSGNARGGFSEIWIEELIESDSNYPCNCGTNKLIYLKKEYAIKYGTTGM